eukprot:2049158-Prymnesium_polylepis.1
MSHTAIACHQTRSLADQCPSHHTRAHKTTSDRPHKRTASAEQPPTTACCSYAQESRALAPTRSGTSRPRWNPNGGSASLMAPASESRRCPTTTSERIRESSRSGQGWQVR